MDIIQEALNAAIEMYWDFGASPNKIAYKIKNDFELTESQLEFVMDVLGECISTWDSDLPSNLIVESASRYLGGT